MLPFAGMKHKIIFKHTDYNHEIWVARSDSKGYCHMYEKGQTIVVIHIQSMKQGEVLF